MRAVVVREFGALENARISDVPEPVLAADDILVEEFALPP